MIATSLYPSVNETVVLHSTWSRLTDGSVFKVTFVDERAHIAKLTEVGKPEYFFTVKFSKLRDRFRRVDR